MSVWWNYTNHYKTIDLSIHVLCLYFFWSSFLFLFCSLGNMWKLNVSFWFVYSKHPVTWTYDSDFWILFYPCGYESRTTRWLNLLVNYIIADMMSMKKVYGYIVFGIVDLDGRMNAHLLIGRNLARQLNIYI